ncbi:hypothetical protein QW131_21230 [Roseibium salinum]|nr:hypothetical protein [Roseibium salinum]
MWSAAHITLYAPGRPSMFYLHDRDVSPWIDVADVQARGLMVVWRGDRQQPPSEFLRLYPGAVRDGHKVFAYQTPRRDPRRHHQLADHSAGRCCNRAGMITAARGVQMLFQCGHPAEHDASLDRKI